MKGLFDLPNRKKQTGPRPTCVTCGMYQNVLSPRMEPFGDFRLGILNVGEAPGDTEDKRGKQWQGKMGQVLQRMYRNLGVDLFQDCLNINACNCRPMDSDGNNRTPTDKEIASCRQRVTSIIKSYKPKVIVLLGQSAVTSVIGGRWPRDLGTISKWRGWTIPDRDFRAWICPTFHPSFVERGEREIETIWKQDLERALGMTDVPFPEFSDESNKVEIVENLDFLLDLQGPVAFDFETTGLKPHDTDRHKVICMSVCNNPDKAYAFMTPHTRDQRRNLRMFLKSDTPKIAQNMKFEHMWSYNVFHCEVNNWIWDTMLATHVLDNRPDITGLKFQAYVQFGVMDYDSDISSFLKSKDGKNGNDTNQIEKLVETQEGRQKLLTYCGLDSLFEYRLAMKQMKELQ